jgi:hypothetical protein
LFLPFFKVKFLYRYFVVKVLKYCVFRFYLPNASLNLVRLAVGSPNEETDRDLTGVRNVLKSLNVEFQEKPVIQVLLITPGIPGIINGLFGVLWCNVKVNAFYIGEETRLFIDVSDVCKALMSLAEMPLHQCPGQCANCDHNFEKK